MSFSYITSFCGRHHHTGKNVGDREGQRQPPTSHSPRSRGPLQQRKPACRTLSFVVEKAISFPAALACKQIYLASSGHSAMGHHHWMKSTLKYASRERPKLWTALGCRHQGQPVQVPPCQSQVYVKPARLLTAFAFTRSFPSVY